MSIFENIGQLQYIILYMPLLIIANIIVYFTPLVFVSHTSELFEFPKMYFVFILGGTLLFLHLLKVSVQNEQQIKHIRINWRVSLALISAIISTIFSNHLYTSIWGYYSRVNGGLMSLLTFFAIYYVLSHFNEKDFERIFNLIILTTIPIGAFGIFQHFAFSEDTRIYSTMGQPNWLASYIVMVLPLILEKLLKNARYMPFWIIIYTMSFATLWYTYSVSGFLGFVACIVVLLLSQWRELREKYKILILLVVISTFIAGTQPGIFANKIRDTFLDIQKVNAQTSETPVQISDSGYIRMKLWQGTIMVFLSSPKNILIGTGPETFPYEFQKFRPAELNYSSEWNFILNKPHNQYLENLVEEGLLGLVSTVVLMIYILRISPTTLKSAFVGIFVANMFGWFTVSTSLLFWVYLSYIDRVSKVKGTY